MSSKRFGIRQLIIFVALVCVFSLTVYLGALFLSAPSVSSWSSEDYTVLTLVLYQSVQYKQEDITYEFSYVLGGQGKLLTVYAEGQSESYVAVSGASLNSFNLKITIYSANEQMLVLHIMQSEGN